MSIFHWPPITWPAFALAGMLIGAIVWRQHGHNGPNVVAVALAKWALGCGIALGIARIALWWVER